MMMKRVTIIAAIYLFILPSLISAAEYPRIEPYVNDFADILTDEQEMQLNLFADALEKNTTIELAFVSVFNTNGEDRVLYANRIGDVNGVGKKDTDNGVVVLFSLDNERGGAIAVGRGIESTLNDAKVGRIGRNARQYFDEGKAYEGYLNIAQAIQSEVSSLENQSYGEVRVPDEDESSWMIAGMLLGIFFFVAIIIIREQYDGSLVSISSGSLISSGVTSSGGRSFGSFGRGSFGGGGAGF